MMLTKFVCMICGRKTEPDPEYADDIEGEIIEKDVCEDCKDAVLFARKCMAEHVHETAKMFRREK